MFITIVHIPRSVLELCNDGNTQPCPTASDMSSKSLGKTVSTQPIQPNVNAKVDLISTLSHNIMIIPRPEMTVVHVEHILTQKIHFVSLQNVT